ncbi:MAG: rRNA pseudouridine synthase [Treponema sp.]|nr:rRNA pseudouridine synthase [Treponema sp.]
MEAKGLRLQVFLAHAGVASRRAGEALIEAGRVAVNGEVVRVPGTKVSPGDRVEVDGRVVRPEERLHYLVLNKPAGYICASSDPQGRPLALELLPPLKERLYNVGRLDLRSSGLIIFTNDGEFAARLGHPASDIEKEYLVESTVPVSAAAVSEFLAGVLIDGEWYKAKRIERMGRKTIRVVLVEGKNREIRRVFSRFHLHAEKLRRIRIGPVVLGDLAEGASRPLTGREREELYGRRD